MQEIHYTSSMGNGTIFLEDHEKLNQKELIERIKDVACVDGNIKIVSKPVQSVEMVTQKADYDAQVHYTQAKQAITGTGEDTELWPLKLELAQKYLDGDEKAGDTLEIMLTKRDFGDNKKDKKTTLKAISTKIVEKSNSYRAKVMRLDGIYRNYKQSIETAKSAEDVAAASEQAKTQFNLLMTE